MDSKLWAERGAALSFSQYFWFRSIFALPSDAPLKAACLGRLSDPKLEVRELASTTLSGLLKGLCSVEAAELRGKLLREAKRLLPARRRRSQNGGTQRGPTMAQRAADRT